MRQGGMPGMGMANAGQDMGMAGMPPGMGMPLGMGQNDGAGFGCTALFLLLSFPSLSPSPAPDAQNEAMMENLLGRLLQGMNVAISQGRPELAIEVLSHLLPLLLS